MALTMPEISMTSLLVVRGLPRAFSGAVCP
jgi:hypothetical protein